MFISKELNMLQLQFFFLMEVFLCVIIKHTTGDYGTKSYASWWKNVCVYMTVCVYMYTHKHDHSTMEPFNIFKLEF